MSAAVILVFDAVENNIFLVMNVIRPRAWDSSTVAKISEILRVTAVSTFPQPLLVVLVFCAGNRHSVFIIFSSYFVMIVRTKKIS